MIVNYSTNAYGREKYIISASALDGRTRYVRVIFRNAAELAGQITADYATLGSDITIDLTDLVTAYIDFPSEVMLQELDANKSQTPGTVIEFLDPIVCHMAIDPRRDIIPKSPYDNNIMGGDGLLVPPPTFILNPIRNVAADPAVILEVIGGATADPVSAWSINLLTDRPVKICDIGGQDTYTEIELGNRYNSVHFRRASEPVIGVSPAIQLAPSNRCKTYVMVQWVSRYGGRKQLVWELRDVKNAVTSRIDLDTFSGVDVRKEYDMTATLHLPKLCPYDHWYYSDIIYSDDVRIMPLGMTGRSRDYSWRYERVDVATKNVQQPNGITSATDLNINITWRNYGKI